MEKKAHKYFFATNWAIDNKTSVYILTIFITVLGLMSYNSLPKESFPDIVIPTIMVSAPYPGTSPEDMENLVTRPIEKQIKGLGDVKKITSKSVQDFSIVVVEFNTDIEISECKQRVKDAVDKARTDLPNNLPDDPNVAEIDFSEFPILYINISGDYDLDQLKKYADIAQDRIESLKEITRVDIVGALEREIQINVDMYKMQAASVTMTDLERAISSENLTISAGNIATYGMKRSLRVAGQFTRPEQIENIVLKSSSGAILYIKDVADVVDGFKEQESFSRLEGQNVITLNIIKRSGENLLDASDKIKDIINNDLEGKVFPSDLKITLTGDQSKFTRNTLEELINTQVIGFLLVTLILMFFMGFNNAFFVGLSVPLSMFIAYLVLPGLDFSMNMIVMFAFIFALGIVVDDAIVVIENTHRVHKYEPNIVEAAKQAAGEVFLPILSGTLTTLAPFFPLIFWPGITGEFMKYIPITLIITLFASLFVAYVINPVFAVSFMKHDYEKHTPVSIFKKYKWLLIVLAGAAAISYLIGWVGIGNFLVFIFIMMMLFHYVINKMISYFQETIWPYLMSLYDKQLRFVLYGRRPYYLLFLILGLFVFTIYLTGVVKPKVLFFPDNDPNTIDVFVSLPVGTDQKFTDSIATIAENRIYEAIGKNNPIVESVITNVALGASSDFFDRTSSSHLAKITINFVEFKYRKGDNTSNYIDRIREKVQGIAGAEIVVQKNEMGPPTGKPINIEITSENLDQLIDYAAGYQRYLDSLQVPGVEELKSDFQANKPEIIVKIDRERANREGISTGQIAMEIRTAVFGKEVSKFKEDEDEYDITLRYREDQRKNINQLLNLKIIYRDMNSGMLREIPLSSVASFDYSDTYGGIKRNNLKRVITLSSEVLSGYTANEVVANIKTLTDRYPSNPEIVVSFTGEQEDQAESTTFLLTAMIISIGLIFFVLISQFNSISKAIIILSEVVFSIIGVLLGVIIFKMPIVIVMTGLGIVALGGIVVRNGILIVEFTDVLRARGHRTLEAIIMAGKTRITPVVLTATATMLGLVPLAIGMTLNFVTMFTELNPQLHFGGDNVMFWGPLSWTIIFGLSFATFLTLIFVPAMYLIAEKMKIAMKRGKSNRTYRKSLKKA